MHRLRWALLTLYVLLVIPPVCGITLLMLVPGAARYPIWICFVGLSVVVQVVFLVAIGWSQRHTPIGRDYLLMPTAIAGLMMAILTLGFRMSLGELIWGRGVGPTYDLWLLPYLIAWAFWGTFFYIRGLSREGRRTAWEMVAWIIGVSLLELLVGVLSHAIVISGPPHLLMGLWTMASTLLGTYVLAWALGPAMVLWFWSHARKRMAGRCPACGYDLHGLSERRCPECGRAFTFAEIRMTAEELGFGEYPQA
jgi:hypothetical protein